MRAVSPLAVILAGVLAVWTVPVSAQVEVTTCGQVVTGDAFLSADLDCAGFTGESLLPERVGHVDPPAVTGAAVLISKRGRLDLRGHTIVGGAFGVFCGVSCTIVGGGGAITGASIHGVVTNKKLVISDTTIADNVEAGLYVQGTVIATRCDVSTNKYGIWIPKVAKVVDSTILGNWQYGVAADRPKFLRSNVTGNGTDIVATHRPILKTSTCETSRWGEYQLNVCPAP